MNVDIDNRRIGFFRIGDSFVSNYKRISGVGYSVYINNGIVTGFHINLSGSPSFIEREIRLDGKEYRYVDNSPEPVFSDKVIYNGLKLTISKNTTPKDVSEMFSVACDYWDDDSYMGMAFVIDGCEIEFSWRSGNIPKLECIVVEASL